MDFDGGSVRRLTEDASDDLGPFWSPNGKFIGFTTNRDGNYEIYVMRSDGSEPHRLTERAGSDGQGSWSL